MLKKVKSSSVSAAGHAFAIVASKYNRKFVDGMLRAARAELKANGASLIKVVRVPGAFEIPAVAAVLAASKEPNYAAVICLGVILQGETTHADHIGQSITHAFANLQIQSQKPIVHETLQFSNVEQARVRCLGKEHNRGAEAAQTAIEMAKVMRSLKV
jgi:6,7-dimethyl-8-ribityllumazine synthase